MRFGYEFHDDQERPGELILMIRRPRVRAEDAEMRVS